MDLFCLQTLLVKFTNKSELLWNLFTVSGLQLIARSCLENWTETAERGVLAGICVRRDYESAWSARNRPTVSWAVKAPKKSWWIAKANWPHCDRAFRSPFWRPGYGWPTAGCLEFDWRSSAGERGWISFRLELKSVEILIKFAYWMLFKSPPLAFQPSQCTYWALPRIWCSDPRCPTDRRPDSSTGTVRGWWFLSKSNGCCRNRTRTLRALWRCAYGCRPASAPFVRSVDWTDRTVRNRFACLNCRSAGTSSAV